MGVSVASWGRVVAVIGVAGLVSVAGLAVPAGADTPVTITVAPASVSEGAVPPLVEFRAVLSRPAALPVSFEYSTTNGCVSYDGRSCASDTDYVATAGSIVFTPGETVKTFMVAIVPDTLPEGGETAAGEFVESFPVDLWAPVNAVYADTNRGGWTALVGARLDRTAGPGTGDDIAGLSGHTWGRIIDDDAGVFVQEPTSCAIEEHSRYVVTVRLSAPATGTVTVGYRTRDFGSAQAGRDYKAAQGTLSFAPGERKKTVSLVIIADRLREYREDFAFELTSATGATLWKPYNTGYICIQDRD